MAQISQLVSANEQLQRESRELRAENERLRAELTDIGVALGRLAGPSRRGRGRRVTAAAAGRVEATPKRQRKPITDPELLERLRQALAKARAEKLAAARSAGNGSAGGGE